MNTIGHKSVSRSSRGDEALIRLLFTAGISLSLLTSAATAAETNIVATVGSTSITTDKVRQAIARGGYNVFELDSAKKALSETINTELLAAAARKQGYDQHPAIVERVNQFIVEELVREKVDKPLEGLKPTDEELKAHYESHKDEFSQPGAARAGVMTIYITPGKEASASNRVAEVLASLKDGKTFEETTARSSDDPSERVSRGGGTWFSEATPNRRYPQEVTKAIFSGKANEVSGPIHTPRATYFIKVLEKRPTVIRSFEEMKPVVTRSLLRLKRQQAYDAFCAGLRKEFPVQVNEAQLPKALESTVPGGGPPKGPVE